MRDSVAIENIEEMRRLEGIEDVELRRAIRALRAGDFVKLTLLTGPTPFSGETLLVRITRIQGDAFRGKLAEQPASARLSQLRCGSSVVFTRHHIHSIPKGPPPSE
jgi:hypothetical protein